MKENVTILAKINDSSILMAFFRQYIAPLIVVFIFLLALVTVSARIFLPGDMAAPAPVGEIEYPAEVS